MKILVTGAAGFLGRDVVEAALRRGHDVAAMVRPRTDVARLRPQRNAELSFVKADLRSRAGLTEALTGVDTVLHLAAAKSGDLYAQLGATVVATENLLAAMVEAKVKRLVLVSSFSVYDYLRQKSGSVLDEAAMLEQDPPARDDYAQAKLLQERVARQMASEHGLELTVVRPGVIFGPGSLWNARLGAAVSPTWWVLIGSRATLPLTYVENCAEAIVMAGESRSTIDNTYNVVDDDLLNQRQYAALIRSWTSPQPRVVPLPWTLMRALSRCIWWINRSVFGGRAKVPSIVVPARLHARVKPLQYTHAALTRDTGWKPRFTIREAVERSVQRQEIDAA